MWEAVDIGVLETRVMSIKRKRYLAYLSMKVEYMPVEKSLKSESKNYEEKK